MGNIKSPMLLKKLNLELEPQQKIPGLDTHQGILPNT